MRNIVLILVWWGLAGCTTLPPPELDANVVWERSFEHKVRFHSFADPQLLVVGTQRHLYGLKPQSGDQIWRERNINPAQQDVYSSVDGTSLLISDAAGGQFEDQDTHFLSLKKQTGELQWESPALLGLAAQAVVHPQDQRLVVATLEQPHGDDRGLLHSVLPGKGLRGGMHRAPTLVGLDLESGNVLWRTPLTHKVRLRPTDTPTTDETIDSQERLFNLNAFRPPFIAGDYTCITYSGISCYHSVTGEVAWSHRFTVLKKDLALSYATPLALGERLIVASNSRLMSFDARTGERHWQTPKTSVLPEIVADTNTAYAQLGGQFYDLDSERWVWRGDFGAMAVDLDTGTHLWHFKKAKKSITNLQIVDQRVWLADSRNLFSLIRRTGAVDQKIKHRFKEQPVFAVLNRDKNLVLVSQTEAAAFDQNTGQRLWYAHYPKPKPTTWRRVSAQLLRLSGGLLRVGSMAVSISSGLVPTMPAIPIAGVGLKVFSSKRLLTRTTKKVASNFRGTASAISGTSNFTDLGEHYQYFLTQIDGVDEVVMASVDINTGATVGLVELPSSDPNLVIDHSAGVLYQASGQKLTAIDLRAN